MSSGEPSVPGGSHVSTELLACCQRLTDLSRSQNARSNTVSFGLLSSRQPAAFSLAAVHTAFGLVLQPYALVYFDPPGIANA